MKPQKFIIKEPFGIGWSFQYTVLKIRYEGQIDIKKAILCDPLDNIMEADFLSFKNNELEVGIMLSLYPYEVKALYIKEDTDNSPVIDTTLLVKELPDCLNISNGSLSLDIPKDGLYEDNIVPAPIISITNDNMSGQGSFTKPIEKANIKVKITSSPLHSLITIKYDLFEHGKYQVQLKIFKYMNELIITEHFDIKNENSFVLSFPSMEPKDAYARMHTPQKAMADPDEWKRITYVPSPNHDAISLQPFYSWGYNCATLVQYWKSDDVLCIVPINPSQWENPLENPVYADTKSGVSIEAVLVKGKRTWVLSLTKENALDADKKVDFTTHYQNWENMIKTPITKVYKADTICAVYGGPNLTDALEWISSIPQDVESIPMLLGTLDDIEDTRKRIQKWPWMHDAITNHKDDPTGFDPAGVYMALNDEDYASKAKQCISKWLLSRIELLTTMGYSIHEAVCIRLSRPLRQVVLDYDLTSHSKHYSFYDKEFIYSAFVFLFRSISSKDYWPDEKNGFNMGNRNFHSDHFATLGICACLLKDYPYSAKVIQYVQRQVVWELQYCVKNSGAWIEAPNYQAYSMNYLITLFAALRNSGFKDFSNDYRFRKTLDFLANIQTCFDVRYGANMLPTIGDTAANYWSQSFANIFAWAASLTKGSPFSKRMMRAWKRAGSPVICPAGEQNSSFKMLLLVDDTLDMAKDTYKSFLEYEGFGAIMRGKDSYLCIKSGDISMHYDHDESSLIWYENNTPILLDIGSQYFPSCDAAFMHNRISIDGKTDQSRGTIIHRECNNKAGLVMTKTDISSLQEWPKWPIADSDWNFRYQQEPYDIPVQTWKRSIIYLMELSALVVIDEVGKDLPFEQNFIFCAKGYKKKDNRFDFISQFGTNATAWVFNCENSAIYNWGYKGLDEPSFKNAFSLDWKQYRWMWDKKITAMAEEVQILRNSCAPNARIITFITANKNARTQDAQLLSNPSRLAWTINGKTITINLASWSTD